MSHHPPIGVGHGENDNWTYDIVSAPSTKFLGNSVEIYPVGRLQDVLHDCYQSCIARAIGGQGFPPFRFTRLYETA